MYNIRMIDFLSPNYIPDGPLCPTDGVDFRVPHCKTMVRFGILAGRHSNSALSPEYLIESELKAIELSTIAGIIEEASIIEGALPDEGHDDDTAEVVLDWDTLHPLFQQLATFAENEVTHSVELATIRTAYEYMLTNGGCRPRSLTVRNRVASLIGRSTCFNCPFADDPTVQNAKRVLIESTNPSVPEEWKSDECGNS